MGKREDPTKGMGCKVNEKKKGNELSGKSRLGWNKRRERRVK